MATDAEVHEMNGKHDGQWLDHRGQRGSFSAQDRIEAAVELEKPSVTASTSLWTALWNSPYGTGIKIWCKYSVRRILRVYPAYTIILLLMTFNDYFAHSYWYILNSQRIWSYLSLQKAEFIFWSIPPELQYYCYVPIIVIGYKFVADRSRDYFKKYPLVGSYIGRFASMFVIVIARAVIMARMDVFSQGLLKNNAQYFLSGSLAAIIYYELHRINVIPSSEEEEKASKLEEERVPDRRVVSTPLQTTGASSTFSPVDDSFVHRRGTSEDPPASPLNRKHRRAASSSTYKDAPTMQRRHSPINVPTIHQSPPSSPAVPPSPARLPLTANDTLHNFIYPPKSSSIPPWFRTFLDKHVLPSKQIALRSLFDLLCYATAILVAATMPRLAERLLHQHIINDEDMAFERSMGGFPYAALIIFGLLSRNGTFCTIFSWSLLRFCGKISFSLYLLHPLAFHIVNDGPLREILGPIAAGGRDNGKPTEQKNDMLDSLLVTFLVSIGLAWVSFTLIEAHSVKVANWICRRWFNTSIKKPRQEPPRTPTRTYTNGNGSARIESSTSSTVRKAR